MWRQTGGEGEAERGQFRHEQERRNGRTYFFPTTVSCARVVWVRGCACVHKCVCVRAQLSVGTLRGGSLRDEEDVRKERRILPQRGGRTAHTCKNTLARHVQLCVTALHICRGEGYETVQAQPFLSAPASTFALSSDMLRSCAWNCLSNDPFKLASWVANFDSDSFSTSACVCKDALVTALSHTVRSLHKV